MHKPYGIAAGADGALWFTSGRRSIGRITTAGVITNYTERNLIDQPIGITAGPDGALWFTNLGDASIGRITPVPDVSISPTSGDPGTSVTVSGEGYQPGEQVDVNYKTGLASPKKVAICDTTANPNGTFSCMGSIPTTNDGADGTHTIQAGGQTSGAVAQTPFTLT
jgi:hypothetical protein